MTTPEPAALLPCPFCGEATAWPMTHFYPVVRCGHCAAEGPPPSPDDRDPTEDDAMVLWNRRATPADHWMGASEAEPTTPTQADQAAAYKSLLAEAQAENARLRKALEEIRYLPGEINTWNYNHDDACELNRQFCYAYEIAKAALGEARP